MLKYILKRLCETIPTTFGIILLSFVLFNVIGGSPAETLLGKNATPEAIAAFNAKWGYDKPLPEQFVSFVFDICRGRFGYSVEYQESVAEVLKRGIMPSLSLTVPILLGSVFVALSLSLVAAKYRGRSVDKAILLCSTVVMSVNYVIWVLAGQFFLSHKAGLFPVWGYESATFLLLPVLIGVISSLGTDVRFFRSAVLDEIYRPYVLSLRAKGLSSWSIMTRHVLRNSLIPIVTYISLSIPYLFTGSLLLEGFFGIPGLGSVSINAIHSSDMAVVRAVVIIGALLYQFINLTTDVLYAWLDPRVRLDL